MRSTRLARTQGGFTLIELMIAALIMGIIFMALISSMTGAFLTTDAASMTTRAQGTARRLLEETRDYTYDQLLLMNGSAIVTDDGMSAKYQVYETSIGLLTVEVEVCRLKNSISPTDLAAMSMPDFHALDAVAGVRVRLTTLSRGAQQ